MQQTDRQSTRQQPILLYVTAAVMTAIAAAGHLLLEWNPLPKKELVQWQPLSTAIDTAKEKKKPLLYFFTAEWCGPCKKLRAESFTDSTVATYMNSNFVPVIVIDRNVEDGKNSPAVKKLQETFSIDSFPSLCTAYPDQLDHESNSLYSADNSFKASLRRYSYELPMSSGYKNKRDILEYLHLAKLWYTMPPTYGQVHWREPKELNTKCCTRAKPTLIVMMMRRDRMSNDLRVEFLNSKTCSDFVDKYFEPFYFEFSRLDDIASTQGRAICQQFEIKKFPAMIVLNSNQSEPVVSTGYSDNTSSLDFLERATHGKAVPPKLENEHGDYNYGWNWYNE